MPADFDIVIVGGGMVGLACAAALANIPLNIALIENKEPNFDWNDNSYDLRVSAINAATQQMLINFQVWNDLVAERVSRYDSMFVWVDNATLTLNAADVHRPELGFIIENRLLCKALWKKVAQQTNTSIICPKRLSHVQQSPEIVQLHIDSGKTIAAKLVIGADGANSWLRQQLTLPCKTRDYHQHALVTTVTTDKPHQQTAWQHFLPQGPLAFLPLSDAHHCSIVWSTTSVQAKWLQQTDTSTFNESISAAFQHKLGSVQVQAPRLTLPLVMQHLQDYVTTRTAFIGDAAHRIHPLAGQGVNLGFMDAVCLAENIKLAVAQHKDIAAPIILQRYQRERKYYNGKMLLLMDILKTSFATPSPTMSTLRNLALEKINKLPFAKQLLTKQALGIEQWPETLGNIV